MKQLLVFFILTFLCTGYAFAEAGDFGSGLLIAAGLLTIVKVFIICMIALGYFVTFTKIFRAVSSIWKKTAICLLAVTLPSAYLYHYFPTTEPAKVDVMDNFSHDVLKKKYTFICTQESKHLPPSSALSEATYREALRLETLPDQTDKNAVAKKYLDAIKLGNADAIRRVEDDQLRNAIIIDAAPELANADHIPYGYFLLASNETSLDARLNMMRYAADWGSADAQFSLGQNLQANLPSGKYDFIKPFYACAAEQNHPDAALAMAKILPPYSEGHFNSAILQYLQQAIKFGNREAAKQFATNFIDPHILESGASHDENDLTFQHDKETMFLGIYKPDMERFKRYKMIWQEASKPGATFPDIDKIVPLPPASLPEWDGTFAYKKELAKEKIPDAPPPESEDAKHMPPNRHL